MIRNIEISDASDICNIYNYYIQNSIATFEEQILYVKEMEIRIAECISSGLPWIVFEEENKVIGYGCLSKWKGRCSYRHSFESSVYVQTSHQKKGIGSKIYDALLNTNKVKNSHVIIGGISLPNEASIILHEKFGFKKVAHFKEVGFKFDQWVDVGYWQKTID